MSFDRPATLTFHSEFFRLPLQSWPALAEQWVKDSEARLPALRGRLYPFSVPSENGKATFRDAETARLIRERIQEILDLR